MRADLTYLWLAVRGGWSSLLQYLRFLEFVAELCRRAWLALWELVWELRGAGFGRARLGDLRGQQCRELFWFELFIG